MNCEENWPRGFREVVQRCGWINGQTDDGWQVITIAQPEPKNLIRFLWPLCICPAFILTLLQVSNHYLENCRNCRDKNPTMPRVQGKFSKCKISRVTKSSNKILIRV